MTYKQIVNRMQDIQADLERLAERAEQRGGLESAEESEWTELRTEFEDLDGQRKALEREADLLKVKQARVTEVARAAATGRGVRTVSGDHVDSDPLGEPDSIEENRFKNPWDLSEVRMGLTPAARGAELRSRALSAIEKMQGTTDRRREVATRMVEQYDTPDGKLAQQVLVSSSPQYLRAFEKLARTSGRAQLHGEEADAVERAMSLTDSAGGYLVPFQLDPTVILTSDGSVNQIRQIARTVVATGDVWNGVSAGAVSWSFDAEADEVSDDSPTFASPSVTVRTARGFVPISLEAFQDENNVTTEVGRLLAQGREDLEASVFITGVAASNQPVGIVTALVAADGASVQTSTTTDTFAVADLYKVVNSLPARYRARASWLGNPIVQGLVRQFGTNLANAWVEGLQAGAPAQLLGYPVYDAEAMDGTINATQENYILAFGDFSNFVIADRIGMTVEFIPNLVGANRRPTGQKGWFAYYRTGSGVVNAAGLRLLNVT